MKTSVGRAYGKVVEVQKIWLSKSEAMAYLDCSSDYLEKLRNSAQVCFAQIDKKYYYELRSINRFIEKHRVI